MHTRSPRPAELRRLRPGSAQRRAPCPPAGPCAWPRTPWRPSPCPPSSKLAIVLSTAVVSSGGSVASWVAGAPALLPELTSTELSATSHAGGRAEAVLAPSAGARAADEHARSKAPPSSSSSRRFAQKASLRAFSLSAWCASPWRIASAHACACMFSADPSKARASARARSSNARQAAWRMPLVVYGVLARALAPASSSPAQSCAIRPRGARGGMGRYGPSRRSGGMLHRCAGDREDVREPAAPRPPPLQTLGEEAAHRRCHRSGRPAAQQAEPCQAGLRPDPPSAAPRQAPASEAHLTDAQTTAPREAAVPRQAPASEAPLPPTCDGSGATVPSSARWTLLGGRGDETLT